MKNKAFLFILATAVAFTSILTSCGPKTAPKVQEVEEPAEILEIPEEVPAAETETNKEIINISVAGFQSLVSSQPFVVVDFHATWCGPCKVMAPHLKKIESEYEESQLKIVKIDVDKNQLIANYFNIQSIPTLKLYKSGKEVNMAIGGLDEVQLREMFKPYL